MLMKLYVCMEICLSLILVNCFMAGMTHLVPMLSQNACCGWGAWCHSLSFETFSFSNSVQPSRSVVSNSLWPHGLQHARPRCSSTTPRVYSNSHPSTHAIQKSHPLSSPSPPAFSFSPASGSFQMSQLFTSGGQTIGVSASTSVLPMNIQDWFPLGWTGWYSLQSKGLSRVFSNTTVQKHQIFGTQLSLYSNSHTHTWLLEKP